ncbi:hypothetical protein GE061_009633 [Apolygus lucorum]|uniref:Uncharacterized protein n=1 Tax=Apolygus lucorum TaxID=248454 RepID=A0A8S9Y2T1_APOLU|nr:hypothetical protein GE061_009633 [Apolygus lucorum]
MLSIVINVLTNSMKNVILMGTSLILGVSVCESYMLGPISHTMFPEDFLFGVATSAYQIEGGWNEDGKGPSIWDNITHEQPNFTIDSANGDISADSYHKYKEDVELIENIGFQVYRFSMSWSRILPNGRVDNVNQAGIDYYLDLLNELVANGIQPMYAELLFQTFGDKVKWWLTFNEPAQVAQGYVTETLVPADFTDQKGIVDYQVAHNLILAHAAVYRVYQQKYSHQEGKISLAIICNLCIPATDTIEDKAASERCFQFSVGWFAHPIFIGDYPPVMRERIDRFSIEEGRNTSRLPYFTRDEIDYIKGTADFFAANHYSISLAAAGSEFKIIPSYVSDAGYYEMFDPNWPSQEIDRFKVQISVVTRLPFFEVLLSIVCFALGCCFPSLFCTWLLLPEFVLHLVVASRISRNMPKDEAAEAAAKLQEMTLNDQVDKEMEAYLEAARKEYETAKKAGVKPRGRPNPNQRRKRYHPFERPPAQPVGYAPVTTVAPDGTVEVRQLPVWGPPPQNNRA